MGARANTILSIYSAVVMAVLLLGCVRMKRGSEEKDTRFIWMVRLCIVYLVSNAVSYICVIHDFDSSKDALPQVLYHGSVCVGVVCYYTILWMMVYYVTDLIRENAPVPGWIPRMAIPVAAVGSFGWCTSSFTGLFGQLEGEGYIPGPLYWVGQISGYLIIGILIFLIFRYHKSLGHRRTMVFIAVVFVPILAVVLRRLHPPVNFLPLGIALSLIIVRNLVDTERAKTVDLQEDRLREGRIRLMLSQIQPHFLYNILNTIYVLCEQKPRMAQKAIEEFSEFLRANLGSLESDRSVSFEQEMNLVRHYLYLEQMRYQEDLRVEFDLAAKDFVLPPLTLQPLVENAVKHGLAKAPGGGTVKITSRDLPDAYLVEVTDDGVGFSPENYLGQDAADASSLENPSSENGRTAAHVGLRSVRERLLAISGGSLEIESAPGRGTCARILLPKEEK